jgi:mono/diheme cytochrome c family protein
MKNTNDRLMWSIVVITTLIAVGLIVFIFNKNWMGTETLDTAMIGQGATIYTQHCASCHGKNLEGQPDWKNRHANGRLPAPPHDETGHTWHHSDQLIFELTKYGMVPPNIPEGYESDMPAFEKKLSDDEIRAVIYFIKSRWPVEIRQMQSERNTNSAQFTKP